MKNNIAKEAKIIAAALENNDTTYLEWVENISSSRITLIDNDGAVIFDSQKKESENHSDRPEFIEAVKNGSAQISRLSETLRQNTYYYAILLSDGTVLRVSQTTSSIFSDLLSSITYVIIITAAIIVFMLFVSNYQTKRIVRPINEIDLDDLSNDPEYKELEPLIKRLSKQNSDIRKYIKKLQVRNVEFATVTENMSEGLIIINNQEILSCNKSALKILCNEEFNYKGKNIKEINHSSAFISAVESALSGNPAETHITLDNKKYMIIASPVIRNKKVKGAVILLIDVTEKNSRDELRREFSANVSHELKTPLTTISGYAEIMKEGWADPKDYKIFAEKIYNEGKRLINLIEDIIKLSHLDENDTSINREPVNLLELSYDIAERLTEKAQRKNIKINVSGESSVINGAVHILDEMIFNLCDNAIKYNRENGYVNVSVRRDKNYTYVSVKDNGIGIPAEDIDRVFERFYCVDKSHSKETGGTGLGLSIVKHGAIFHKAKIDISSTLNQGTIITITFNNKIKDMD